MTKKHRHEDGMTILEILVVLAILVGVMGSFSLAMNSSSEVMRAEASRLMGMIRYAYHHTAANSLYGRIVFDLAEQKYFFETSEAPFYVVREGDEKEAMIVANLEKNSGNTTDESDADEGSNLSGDFSENESELLEPFQVNSIIRLAGVFVDHQKEPVSEGMAYLYFFPGGQTELAVIHFSDEEGENFLTLSVNPLTGWVDVRTEYVEYTEYVESAK